MANFGPGDSGAAESRSRRRTLLAVSSMAAFRGSLCSPASRRCCTSGARVDEHLLIPELLDDRVRILGRARRGSAGSCSAGIAPGAGGGSTSTSAFDAPRMRGRVFGGNRARPCCDPPARSCSSCLGVGDRGRCPWRAHRRSSARRRRASLPCPLKSKATARRCGLQVLERGGPVREIAREGMREQHGQSARAAAVGGQWYSDHGRASCPRPGSGNLSAFAASEMPGALARLGDELHFDDAAIGRAARWCRPRSTRDRAPS